MPSTIVRVRHINQDPLPSVPYNPPEQFGTPTANIYAYGEHVGGDDALDTADFDASYVNHEWNPYGITYLITCRLVPDVMPPPSAQPAPTPLGIYREQQRLEKPKLSGRASWSIIYPRTRPPQRPDDFAPLSLFGGEGPVADAVRDTSWSNQDDTLHNSPYYSFGTLWIDLLDLVRANPVCYISYQNALVTDMGYRVRISQILLPLAWVGAEVPFVRLNQRSDALGIRPVARLAPRNHERSEQTPAPRRLGRRNTFI